MDLLAKPTSRETAARAGSALLIVQEASRLQRRFVINKSFETPSPALPTRGREKVRQEVGGKARESLRCFSTPSPPTRGREKV
jgi:hypothetical protein